MPTVLQFRRGTTSQNDNFTGTLSELSVDTQLDTLRLHDGSTAGGFEITQNAAAQTLTNKTLTTPIVNAGVQLKNGATSAGFLEFFEDSDNGTNKVTLIGPASTADVTITLPAAADTLVGKATTDTLTNKTLTTPILTTPVVNVGMDLKNAATSAGFLKFFEDSDNGTNAVTLIGPASTADVTITLPAATGTLALAANVLALSGGTMAGAIAMGTSKITGAGDPTAAQDVATKAYVDAEVTSVTPVISAGNSNVTVTDSGTGQVVTTVDGVAEVTTVSASTTFGGNLVIPNGGTIGTVGDGDSITIATAGAVTISQALTVTGNLTVNGTTTTLNTAEMKVEDLNIVLADGAADSAAANGAGITIDGADATILYTHSGTKFVMNKPLQATSFTGDVTGDISGTAGIATLVTVSDNESTNESNVILFAAGAAGSGNLGVEADGNMTYNPSTGKITATGFIGDVTGDASGTAGIATLVTVSDNESTNESNVILFAAGGNLGVEADGNMTYNPSTGKITATGFVGALTGDVTGDVTGNADTATLATTVTITDNESTNEANALIFTAGGDVDGGNLGLESDGTLTYNPSTGVVTATGFAGALTGTASIATTITLVATNATDATHFPVFVDTATGNENPRTDTGFTYNSNSGTLTSSVFAGEATSALYADVAEMYLPDADYSAGTVVCIGGSEEVTACSTSAIPAGIVSTDPAYLMNAGLEDGVAVGLIGRLPVRVVGAVTKGQVVKVDSAGVASATGSGERVGIALEASNVTGEKLIECMLKT
jgi:preprotein translocase subunit Sec61beta